MGQTIPIPIRHGLGNGMARHDNTSDKKQPRRHERLPIQPQTLQRLHIKKRHTQNRGHQNLEPLLIQPSQSDVPRPQQPRRPQRQEELHNRARLIVRNAPLRRPLDRRQLL